MNNKIARFVFSVSFCLLLAHSPGLRSAQAAADDGFSPESSLREAQKDLQSAEAEFARGANTSPQKNGQMSWSDAASGQASRHSTVTPQSAAPAPVLQGSPETGYAGTWTDPKTGDIITSVIAPTPPQNSYQSTPIIVEPQVGGGDWGYSGGSGSYQPQWPDFPGNPGYPVPGNPPYRPGGGNYPMGPGQIGSGGFPNGPGQWPGQYPPPGNFPNVPNHAWRPAPPYPGHPGMSPGFIPPNGNFNPSYKPLRPNLPQPMPNPGGMPGIVKPPQGTPGAIWTPNRPVWPSEGPVPPHWGVPGGRPPHWGAAGPRPLPFHNFGHMPMRPGPGHFPRPGGF